MEQEARTLRVAEEVSRLLQQLGYQSALIGSIALAVHNYVRATQDLDLGVSIVEAQQAFTLLSGMLPAHYEMTVRYADDTDDLGGVATIIGEDIFPIQIVNFTNAKRLRKNPGSAAVRDATLRIDESDLRVVSLPFLIAMKLDAGALRDRADVLELLNSNPNLALDDLRRLCADYGLESALDAVLDDP